MILSKCTVHGGTLIEVCGGERWGVDVAENWLANP